LFQRGGEREVCLRTFQDVGLEEESEVALHQREMEGRNRQGVGGVVSKTKASLSNLKDKDEGSSVEKRKGGSQYQGQEPCKGAWKNSFHGPGCPKKYRRREVLNLGRDTSREGEGWVLGKGCIRNKTGCGECGFQLSGRREGGGENVFPYIVKYL